jgi:hypothetical protein
MHPLLSIIIVIFTVIVILDVALENGDVFPKKEEVTIIANTSESDNDSQDSETDPADNDSGGVDVAFETRDKDVSNSSQQSMLMGSCCNYPIDKSYEGI